MRRNAAQRRAAARAHGDACLHPALQVILNRPSADHKAEDAEFEPNEVYAIDIAVSTGGGGRRGAGWAVMAGRWGPDSAVTGGRWGRGAR